jgi:hypothetical protein
MVRTYIRKGGHGGDRSKVDLPVGYWQEKAGKQQRLQQKRIRIARGRGSKARGVDGGVTATGVLSHQRGNLITIVITHY